MPALPPSDTLEPGSTLCGGRYEVKRKLGGGSQGTTYEATDAQTGERVAIKRFDVRGAKRWKDVELAEREARVLATLDHPLVPRYRENFEEDGALYLVMTMIEGETLEAIRKRGPVPEAEVHRFLTSADRALTYLHGRSARVVHRDLKPSNVIRRDDGSYVLVDFGAVAESLVRRGSSTIVGTIGYMAPEQLQGRAAPASDVYAVGATALAALTGADPETLPHRGLRIDVRAALAGRAGEALITGLERMLEPDPDLRAQSIGAALEARPPLAVPSASPVVTGAGAGSSPLAPSAEDVLVKSLTRLLWVLWAIGWIIVPMIFGVLLNKPELIPVVMFGWLAGNVIIGWHKGAMLRMLVRQWNAALPPPVSATARAPAGASPVKVRVAEAEEVSIDVDDADADAERAKARDRGRGER